MSSPERGLGVFVVEDEALVALNLEDMLEDLGCHIACSAMRVEQAMALIDKGCAPDVAILDVNLAGRPVFPVAARLVEAGVPIVFATGYGRSGLPEEWRAFPVLQKPYTIEQVSQCLVGLGSGEGSVHVVGQPADGGFR